MPVKRAPAKRAKPRAVAKPEKEYFKNSKTWKQVSTNVPPGMEAALRSQVTTEWTMSHVIRELIQQSELMRYGRMPRPTWAAELAQDLAALRSEVQRLRAELALKLETPVPDDLNDWEVWEKSRQSVLAYEPKEAPVVPPLKAKPASKCAEVACEDQSWSEICRDLESKGKTSKTASLSDGMNDEEWDAYIDHLLEMELQAGPDPFASYYKYEESTEPAEEVEQLQPLLVPEVDLEEPEPAPSLLSATAIPLSESATRKRTSPFIERLKRLFAS